MGHDLSEKDFVAGVTQRTKLARERRGWSQSEMSRILQVKHGTYHKYEGRTVMPAYLLLRFCFYTNTTPNEIYYGSGAKAVQQRANITKAHGPKGR